MSIRKKQSKISFSWNRFIVFVSIIVLLSLSFIFNNKIENALGLNKPFYKVVEKEDYIVHFIDVGQGDCTVIEFPNDEIMIIDSGAQSEQTKLVKYLDKVVLNNGKNKIDYLIATHSDSDHVGNMTYIFDKYEVKTVYRPNIYVKDEVGSNDKKVCDTAVYSAFINAMNNEKNCEIKFITDGTIQNIVNDNNESEGLVTFFGPLESSYSDFNDFCPFILIDCCDSKLLITGDASSEVENEILNFYDDVIPTDVDMYHCGHHGSKNSTSQELLNHINCEYAIISCSSDNSYGHPNAETLSRLNSKKIKIYNTAENSNVIFAYSLTGEQNVVCGNFKATDNVRWWMVVVTIIGFSAVIIFSIKIKFTKKL